MFTKISLKTRLIVWGIATLSLVGVIVYQFSLLHQYDAIFNRVLYDKALYINRFYAMVIADALYKKDDIHLLLWIKQLMLDREVATVLIVDSKGDIRYSDDLRKVGEPVDHKRVREALNTGQGYLDKGKFKNSMVLVSPILVSGHSRPIGAVRFEFIKNNTERRRPHRGAEPPRPGAARKDAASAMTHYRNGLIAYQKKDYVTAVQEFKTARKLGPNNRRIFIALTRAEDALAAGRPSLFRD